MPPKRKISQQQTDMLLDFMQQHIGFARGVHEDGRRILKVSSDLTWKELAPRLNSVSDGMPKSGTGWKNYWTELKRRAVLREQDKIDEELRGLPLLTRLSADDLKVLDILGPFEPDKSVQIPFDLPFISHGTIQNSHLGNSAQQEADSEYDDNPWKLPDHSPRSPLLPVDKPLPSNRHEFVKIHQKQNVSETAFAEHTRAKGQVDSELKENSLTLPGHLPSSGLAVDIPATSIESYWLPPSPQPLPSNPPHESTRNHETTNKRPQQDNSESSLAKYPRIERNKEDFLRESNRMFLYSLLPDMDQMSPSQVRKFKIKVVNCLSATLEDTSDVETTGQCSVKVERY